MVTTLLFGEEIKMKTKYVSQVNIIIFLFSLLWQLPGSNSVSEPQEEDVFEHLNCSHQRIELGTFNLLPPHTDLSYWNIHHLTHLENISHQQGKNIQKVVQPSASQHQMPTVQCAES